MKEQQERTSGAAQSHYDRVALVKHVADQSGWSSPLALKAIPLFNLHAFAIGLQHVFEVLFLIAAFLRELLGLSDFAAVHDNTHRRECARRNEMLHARANAGSARPTAVPALPVEARFEVFLKVHELQFLQVLGERVATAIVAPRQPAREPRVLCIAGPHQPFTVCKNQAASIFFLFRWPGPRPSWGDCVKGAGITVGRRKIWQSRRSQRALRVSSRRTSSARSVICAFRERAPRRCGGAAAQHCWRR
jgi:hypothetical protein